MSDWDRVPDTMKRTGTILVALAVVIALTAVPIGAAATFAGGGEADTDAPANDSAAPGEQLAGAVGVQDAELDGEVTERAYGLQIANAQSDGAKADVVETQLEDVEQRLAAHEAELEELREARDGGEISNGTYQAKVATLAAEKGTTERMAGHAGETAGDLPADVLDERGIDVDAIEELRQNASELGGEEVSEIARSIAGDNVGYGVADERGPGAPVDVPEHDRDGDRPDRGADDGEHDDADESDDEGEDADGQGESDQ